MPEQATTRRPALALGVLSLNAVLLISILFRMGPASVTSERPAPKPFGVEAPERTETTASIQRPQDTTESASHHLRVLLDALVAPLTTIAPPPATFPSEAEIDEAVKSGSLSSPETTMLLSRLRAEYEVQGIPFPELSPD